MGSLSKKIRRKVDDAGVAVFFVSQRVTKWYNAHRADITEPILFGGWYWQKRREESGPFKSPSAARRDFYYRRIRKVAPPVPTQKEIAAVVQDEYRKLLAEERAARTPRLRRVA